MRNVCVCVVAVASDHAANKCRLQKSIVPCEISGEIIVLAGLGDERNFIRCIIAGRQCLRALRMGNGMCVYQAMRTNPQTLLLK